MIAPFTLGRTPPPPGQQATAERHAALTPLLERVFPRHQSCDDDGAVWVTTGLTPDMRRLAPNLRRTA